MSVGRAPHERGIGRRPEVPLGPGVEVAVVGLGRSGTAAARLAAAAGAEVYVSDLGSGAGPREAAAALRAEGIAAETGAHDLERIRGADLVVVSPGIDPRSEVRRAIAAAGLRVVPEVGLALSRLGSRVIAITGTNGKTTTTALCAYLLVEGGIRAVAAGNIGRPLSEVALAGEPPEWIALELSSFQLGDLEDFSPEIGVLLNLAPDHLDRYESREDYYADKGRIFAAATADSRWVLNADDPAVREMTREVPGEKAHFSLREPCRPGAWLDEASDLCLEIGDRSERWAPAGELRLLGRHNVANALAAALAAALAGVDGEAIGRGLHGFRPLEHRLQPVKESAGILWVNDSKATNVASTRVAVRSFDRPIVLLLGGRHKGQPYGSLLAAMEGRVRGIVAYGEAAPRIAADLGGAVRVVRVDEGFDEAVRTAAELAEAGDVVLLSPACSSYDEFESYEERGRRFAERVRDLAVHVEQRS